MTTCLERIRIKVRLACLITHAGDFVGRSLPPFRPWVHPQPGHKLGGLFGVPFSSQYEDDRKACTSASSCECGQVVLPQRFLGV